MRKVRKIILVIIFIGTVFYGFFTHVMERGGGFIGGSVHYSYGYGRSYNWESNYNNWQGILKGRFPETKCGALIIGIYEQKNIDNAVFSEHCGWVMGLSHFVLRY